MYDGRTWLSWTLQQELAVALLLVDRAEPHPNRQPIRMRQAGGIRTDRGPCGARSGGLAIPHSRAR